MRFSHSPYSPFVDTKLTHLLPPRSGFARLALDTLKKVKTSRKLILVATSDKWKANDYGLKDDEVLCINQHDVRNELKKRGGAHGIVCESSSLPSA